ncbi:MAG TPA: peptidoglycan DD-metalloendopeptidase family protein [Pyrinomonadaceae bacterium]
MDKPRIGLTIEPRVNGVVRYLALAPSTPNEGERFQLSFQAIFTNREPNPVNVAVLRITFPDRPGFVKNISIRTPALALFGLRLSKAGSAEASRAPMDFKETDNIILTSTPPTIIKFEVVVDGFDLPASFTHSLGRHESPVANGAYAWMGKAHDLRRGECWQGMGAAHCCGPQLYAHDLGVMAFDESINAWSLRLPGKSGKKNEHHRIWGKPVYAMADGTVVGFENNIPENHNPPNLSSDSPPAPGNHFVLRHGTELMTYAHFQRGSLNPDLIRNNVPGAAVRAGDFLGLVGNSGNSDRPHLHIQCNDEASGTLRPIPWHHKMVTREETTRPTGSDWLLSPRQGLAVVNTLIYPGDAMPADGREWSEWKSLGGDLIFGPAVCSWGPNRLDVFTVGTDRALYHKWWNGSVWRDWESLGGELTAKPAAVSWGPNRIDVFGRATDNSLYHKWWDGSRWHDWEGLGGSLLSAPAVSSRRADHLDVFVVATDRSLHQRIWNGSNWTAWRSLGGELTADPATVSWGSNRIDVFGRAKDETLYQKWWDGSSWSDWEPRDSRRMMFGPAVSSRRANRLDVFLVAPDGTLQHVPWDGSKWGRWESLGGLLTADPAAVSWSSIRIDVFGRGADNALYHTYWRPSP